MADKTPKTEAAPVAVSPTETKTIDAGETNDSSSATKTEEPGQAPADLVKGVSEPEKASSSEDKGKAVDTTNSTTDQEGEVREKREVEEEDDDDDDEYVGEFDPDDDTMDKYDRPRYMRSARHDEYDSWYGMAPPSPSVTGPAKETFRGMMARALDENTLPWTQFKPPLPKPVCIVCHNVQRYLLEDKETRMPRGLELKENIKTMLSTARTRPYFPYGQYPFLCFVNDEENVGLSFTDAYVEKRVVYPLANNPDISEMTAAKSKSSKFFKRDNVLAEIKSRGIEKVYLMGGPSDRDIIWSCKGAKKQGLEVILVSGCHGAFDSEEEWHWETERRIEQEARDLGCEVMRFRDVQLEWQMDGVVT